ncbi:Dam family site-specific DNA-(adenine-N6)-methyltransferase [Microbacterium sp. SORGH_AS_0428]|uniref:DNA adenine methylase n=1 Tax=Microbacterium sp. SORGH_AS_0428 TaxID=3041788 RepID=UPI00286B4DBD|nr:Dam family site-specific DNA-(adenine-N6)-methyltransferase [Microbacterium sp. SORGH_AS_0428]
MTDSNLVHTTTRESIHWSHIDRMDVEERAAAILSATPRPFVRWAGSKQRLLSQLTPHFPTRYRTYFEPFFGAGSLFFLLRPNHAVINDSCVPLIEMYKTVRDYSSEVYAALAPMDVLDKELYYEVRRTSPTGAVQRAARFLYLNRAAWNGLYRVNAKGEFNVPYGKPRSGNHLDPNNLRAASQLLAGSNVLMQHGDFEQALGSAGEGDFVFLDPPYASSKRRESFVDYNEKLFTWDDQVRLAARAEELRRAGAHVVVTNAFNTDIRDLYPNFREHPLVRRSLLSSDKTRRRPVAESALVS